MGCRADGACSLCEAPYWTSFATLHYGTRFADAALHPRMPVPWRSRVAYGSVLDIAQSYAYYGTLKAYAIDIH